MPLTGDQVRRLCDVVTSGFDRAGLEVLLRTDLNIVLDHIVGNWGFEVVAFRVVIRVDQEGRIGKLMEAVTVALPDRQDVQQTLQVLRNELEGDGPPSAAGATGWHPLHAYPRGPIVEVERVPMELYPVFTRLYPGRAEILQAVVGANQFRWEADPDAIAINVGSLRNADAVGATNAWVHVFELACIQGPRMVAALLLRAPDHAFGAAARPARDWYLQSLRAQR